MRNNDRAAVPVDGMMQLLVDLLQTVGDSPPLPFGQNAPTTAPDGIIVDMPFQRRVAQQIGMEQHARTAVVRPVRHQGPFDRFARPDDPQPLRFRGLAPSGGSTIQQPVEIAFHADALPQVRLRQIDRANQRMQRIPARQFVEPVDGHERRSIPRYHRRIFFPCCKITGFRYAPQCTDYGSTYNYYGSTLPVRIFSLFLHKDFLSWTKPCS